MTSKQFKEQPTVNYAGMASMEGCAREYLVTGQRFGTTEGHIRYRGGSTYEALAPDYQGIIQKHN